ncbi:MAG: MFS transporter, partial [Armatimonadetes bacterium]|nr:MFS transporter [Armatimonadota bacterium]
MGNVLRYETGRRPIRHAPAPIPAQEAENESPRIARRMTHRPFAALQHDDFRKLMLGQVVSIAGTRMRDVAIAWHLYQLTHSPLLLGMVGVARLVPMVVLGLASGVMADRVDRRRLMMATQVVMLVASLILGLITVSGQVQPWSIYVLLVVSAAAATFDLPARQALIPQLVPREHLPNALSMNMIAYQGASVCGPMVAGLMLAEYGVAAVYFVDAATFLAVLLALVSMEHRHVPRGPEVEVPTWHAALKGLRFVLGNRLILSTMLVDFFAMVFGSASTMMPIFADQVLGVNERGLGMLYAAPGVG